MRIYTDPTAPLTREAADRIGGLLWPAESELRITRGGFLSDLREFDS
jgi:hypothetical protein